MKKQLLFISATVLLQTANCILPTTSFAQVVTTLAGSTTAGSADGTGAAASFKSPMGIATDGSGNLYVADANNNKIRKIVIATGVVTTLAGSTTAGSADGTGAAASFNAPIGIATDGSGNLYVADHADNKIRKIVIATSVVTTLAGSGSWGSDDGTGAAASFSFPAGIASDGSGNLYVADSDNNEIRKIVIATGVVTTLAGSTTAGSADGTGAAASFNWPTGVATDGSGNLYVVDQDNQEIRKIVIATGVVTTIAGSTVSGSADGTGSAASFSYPYGVAADPNGNLYVGDFNNNKIRKIVIATGVVTTLAGSGTIGSSDGTGAAASFYYPSGVATDGNGNLYVADAYNNEIRKIDMSSVGINDASAAHSMVSVYPNPATNNLSIKFEKAIKNSRFEIIDITGKQVISGTLENKINNIDVSSLASGLYLVKITDDATIYTTKFLKE